MSITLLCSIVVGQLYRNNNSTHCFKYLKIMFGRVVDIFFLFNIQSVYRSLENN